MGKMGWTQKPVDPREVLVTIRPEPLAERLRIRKGSKVRVTNFDGSTRDYTVQSVSMPDKNGDCVVAAVDPA